MSQCTAEFIFFYRFTCEPDWGHHGGHLIKIEWSPSCPVLEGRNHTWTQKGYPWSSYLNNRIVNDCFGLDPIQPCGHILTWPTVSCCSAAHCCQAHPLYYTKCVSSSSNKVTLAGPGLPSQTEENCAIMGKPSHTLPCHTTLAEPQVLSKVMLTTTVSYMLTWQLCSIHRYIPICPRNSKWTFQLSLVLALSFIITAFTQLTACLKSSIHKFKQYSEPPDETPPFKNMPHGCVYHHRVVYFGWSWSVS